MTHHEFVFTDRHNPDAAFIAALDHCIPKSGSIIVWNASFETTINRRLAERNPTAAAMMANIRSRIVDLEDPFKQQMLVHPGFRGRTSIKAVLPAFVPELTYDYLNIQDGATASATWNDIATGIFDAVIFDQKRRDLLSYCALDTEAMVEIRRTLQELAVDGCQLFNTDTVRATTTVILIG